MKVHRSSPFGEQDAYEMAREAVSQAFLLLLGGELEGARGMVNGAVQNFAGSMRTSDAERLMRAAELVSEIGRLASEHVGELASMDPCGPPPSGVSQTTSSSSLAGSGGVVSGGIPPTSSSIGGPGSSSATSEAGKDECPVELRAQDPADLPAGVSLVELLKGFAINPERPDAPSPLQELLEGAIRDPFKIPVAAKAVGVYPSNLLLYGPGGTGKTELSRALAREANLWYIEVGSADIKSKWVGQADKCLRKLFNFAKELAKETQFADAHELDPSRKSGVLVFIDEIDGLLGEEEGSDSNLGNVVTAFKTEVQPKVLNELGVVVVGATNRPWTIRDRSVVQRFGVRAYLGLPRIVERIKLFLNAVKSYAREDLPNCLPPDNDPNEVVELGRESVGMSRREIDDFVRQTFSSLPVGLSHYNDLKYCAKDGGLSYVARPGDAQGDECDPAGYGTWDELFQSKPDSTGKAYEDPEKIERQSRICWPVPTVEDLIAALRSGKFVKSTTVKDLELYRKFAKDQTSDSEAFLVRAIESEIQEALQFENRRKALSVAPSGAAELRIEPTYDAREKYSSVVSETTRLLRELEPETGRPTSSSSPESPSRSSFELGTETPETFEPVVGSSRRNLATKARNVVGSSRLGTSGVLGLEGGSEELSPEMSPELSKPFPPAKSAFSFAYVGGR